MLFLFCDSKEQLNLVLSLAFHSECVCVCVGLCVLVRPCGEQFLQISNISVQLYHWKMFFFDACIFSD